MCGSLISSTSMSSSHFSAGKYCCLPGCTSSSYTPNVSLFVVPNGKKIVGMEMLLMCKHGVKNFLEFCSNIVLHQIKILERDAKIGLHISAVFTLKKFIFREQVK